MGVPCRVLLGLSIAVFSMELAIAQRSLNLNCDEVMADPPSFPLTYINECTERQQAADSAAPQMRRSNACRQFTCTNTCVLGWLKDEYGCDTCHCAQDGSSGNFEGDIRVVGDMVEYIKNQYVNPNKAADTAVQRGAARSLPLWKMYKSGDNYIVPYIIDRSIASTGRSAILAAAGDFAKYTCIRLQPRSNQGKYINFYRGGGCSSPVGAVSTRQDVSLASGCWYKGTVIHEVLHSLGFWHEQSRPDRDSYVRIITSNISPNLAYNFNKFSTSQIDSMGSPYDTGSVMHYNSYAFSTNGRATITDLSGNAIRTQRNGFSKSDLEQLNKLYGCKNTGGGGGGTGGDCEDKNENCAYWAGRDECTKNPAYMGPNCCKSCKGTTPATTTKPTTTTTTTTRRTTTTARPTQCYDTNPNCPSWSRTGECTNNPAYMLTYCCKSCRETSCADNNGNCSRWASYGYCSGTYNAFMSKYCKKSCRLC